VPFARKNYSRKIWNSYGDKRLQFINQICVQHSESCIIVNICFEVCPTYFKANGTMIQSISLSLHRAKYRLTTSVVKIYAYLDCRQKSNHSLSRHGKLVLESWKTFSFGHCIICSSAYGFWLPFWYLQTSLYIMCRWSFGFAVPDFSRIDFSSKWHYDTKHIVVTS
jgi:hypothetical protein